PASLLLLPQTITKKAFGKALFAIILMSRTFILRNIESLRQPRFGSSGLYTPSVTQIYQEHRKFRPEGGEDIQIGLLRDEKAEIAHPLMPIFPTGVKSTEFVIGKLHSHFYKAISGTTMPWTT
ncbi:hypothetical protein, partial [Parvimonas sp. M13]|uniref:hypothetical protein n=1 Tax=Parvimonas sp. M13 TaxID=3110694 RepID=UPI002B45E051